MLDAIIIILTPQQQASLLLAVEGRPLNAHYIRTTISWTLDEYSKAR